MFNNQNVNAELKFKVFYLCIEVVPMQMLCVFCVQGLFEYVKPRWEGRPPSINSNNRVDLKKFGNTVPSRPTTENVDISQLSLEGASLPT